MFKRLRLTDLASAPDDAVILLHVYQRI